MTSRFIKLGIAVAATGAALALGAGTASAATTFTVTAGNAAAGTKVNVVGTTQGASPQITFTDSTSGTVLNCASGTAPGFTTTGTGQAGAAIGSILGGQTGWNGCTGPLGLTFVVKGLNTWTINAGSGNAASVNGTISKVKATVDGGSSCKFTVTGSVPIKYTNATQILQVLSTKSNLKVSGLTGGCFGAVNNGDLANFSASYKLVAAKAAQNPVKIVGVN